MCVGFGGRRRLVYGSDVFLWKELLFGGAVWEGMCGLVFGCKLTHLRAMTLCLQGAQQRCKKGVLCVS